jgi:hypothetical protein
MHGSCTSATVEGLARGRAYWVGDQIGESPSPGQRPSAKERILDRHRQARPHPVGCPSGADERSSDSASGVPAHALDQAKPGLGGTGSLGGRQRGVGRREPASDGADYGPDAVQHLR